MSLLPQDPLVRWVFWLMVIVSVAIPLVVAALLAVIQ